MIQDQWIERAIRTRLREHIQADGRIRRWTQVTEMGGRTKSFTIMFEERMPQH